MINRQTNKLSHGLAGEIIDRAQAGNYTNFRLITDWHDYLTMCSIRKRTKLIKKSLTASKIKLFKTYCLDILDHDTDPAKLLTFKELTKLEKFYIEDLAIINDIIFEYEAYLTRGNLLCAVLGLERPTEDMWDHRSL